MARIFLVLAFLAAQFAPAMHAFHAEEEFAPHCTDGAESTHWCECTLDHDAPDCTICTHVARGAALELVSAPAPALVDDIAAASAPDVVRVAYTTLSGHPRGPPDVVAL